MKITLHPKPGPDRDAVAGVTVLSAVDQGGGFQGLAAEIAPPAQAGEHIAGHGLTGFYFHREEPAGLFDEQVDFMAGSVAPEINGWCPAMVQISFGRFRDNVVFEKCAAKGMCRDLGRLPDTQQMAKQPGVVEVEFRAFNHPFVEITVMRRQQKEDEAGVQYR